MKIAICINSYKKPNDLQHHERLCVESLLKVKRLYPDTVDLVNLTFKSETHLVYDGFINLHVLEKSSKDISPKHSKRLPFLNDIFDVLSELKYDYFLFCNNDIAISNRFIKQILKNPSYDSFAASKLHFSKLESIDDITAIPDAISVHGFDAFAVTPEWWINNKNKFSRFILGKPYWDTYFFTMLYVHGKCVVLNKPPCVIYHVQHESDAMDDDDLSQYNIRSFQTPGYVKSLWFRYVYDVLLKRNEHSNIKWYIPHLNEEELEKKYLTL